MIINYPTHECFTQLNDFLREISFAFAIEIVDVGMYLF